ncbi:hypothetical protein WR164_05400 [Philodulcilactobacillus myokoensis]|uniref:Uncharacterized protein n=1 Tax=Philodulcilactobacillus myokoensis TaxID=2929573 RepID=A0A9W6B0Z1_9LACO|nr:hypothetical protein [Philodulcilactobacillus myokoensis]GLB46561.1 hypothetical protein WR164_05400 [Philodulcilactobacillus myokoensis]
MSKLVPENMLEIKQKMKQLSNNGHQVSEDKMIYNAIQTLMQNYLEAAEEGHYDNSIMNPKGNQINAYDVNNHLIDAIQSTHATFIDDFKQDSFKLILRLEEFADYIARQ